MDAVWNKVKINQKQKLEFRSQNKKQESGYVFLLPMLS